MLVAALLALRALLWSGLMIDLGLRGRSCCETGGRQGSERR